MKKQKIYYIEKEERKLFNLIPVLGNVFVIIFVVTCICLFGMDFPIWLGVIGFPSMVVAILNFVWSSVRYVDETKIARIPIREGVKG